MTDEEKKQLEELAANAEREGNLLYIRKMMKSHEEWKKLTHTESRR